MVKVLRSTRPRKGFLGISFLACLLMSSTAANASWKEHFKTLRIGILQSHPMAANRDNLRKFASSYSSRLGIDVDIVPFVSLDALIDAHGNARVHYAVHSARSFATTARICNCLQPIVRPVSSSGATGFRSVLVLRDNVRKKMETSPEDVKIGYSKEDSISGWVLPNAAVKNGEINKLDFEKLGSVKNVIAAFDANEIDGFFSWVPFKPDQVKFKTRDLFNGTYPIATNSQKPLEIVWWSKTVYFGPHAVHNSVPHELRDELVNMILSTDQPQAELADLIEPYFSGGFEKTSTSDYRTLLQALSPETDMSVANIELSLRPSIGDAAR